MHYQPWVQNQNWDKYDSKLREISSQPLYLSHTNSLVDKIDVYPPGILFIRGPRQVGKSTFLREFALKCLNEGVEAEALVLFEAEQFNDRHELLSELELFIRESNQYHVILVDELTSIDKWWLAIKLFADKGGTEKCLLICTGSSSHDIQEGADLMPGRRGKRYPVDFELLPVPYAMVAERLSLEDYFLTGGLPWAINEYLRFGIIPAYVYQLYSSWIEGVFTRKGHSLHHLDALLHYTARRIGVPVSVQKMSRDCGIGSNRTAEIYLSLLFQAYAIISSFWISPHESVFAPRKNRKFYPADPFLLNLFFDYNKGWDFAFELSKERLSDPGWLGAVAETAVANHLRYKSGKARLGYWLGRKEIDFVVPELLEVKYQKHVSISEFEWVYKVLIPGQKLTVVTKHTNASKDNIRLIDLRRWLLE